MSTVKITLVEGDLTNFEKATKNYMTQAIEHFKQELAAVRSGRAHTSMIEDIKVSCYGGASELKLRELAALSAPDVNLLVVEPWDKSLIEDIEKAITKSDLGVNPANDGNLIRIQLPGMSAQRREELTKILHKKLEDARISIRSVRKDLHNIIRDQERAKALSEDFSKRLMDKLQKLTDQYIQMVEEVAKKKEAEIKGA